MKNNLFTAIKKTGPRVSSTSFFLACQPLLSSKDVIKIPKGTIIYYQGEVPRHGSFVKSGCIKVYNLSTEGEEQLVSFITEHEVCPSIWLFGHSQASIYFYETMTDCEVYNVGRDEFMQYIMGDPLVTQTALKQYAKDYVSSLMRITALEQTRAYAKIRYTFYFLAQRYGKPLANGHSEVSIPLTQQQFANFVGLTRETTATEIKKLRDKGFVSSKHQKYIVNTDKLLRSMGEDSFKNLNL
jgi:CRP-like cAMP-binding protein